MKNENEKMFLEFILKSDTKNMLQLGKHYYLPKNDFDSALICFEKAFSMGDNDALIWIARVNKQLDIQNINVISKDNVKYSNTTIEWYQKALNYFENNYMNNVEYAFEAGNLLSKEDVLKVDFKKAFEYFYCGANFDSDNKYEHSYIRLCQAHLSKMYELGLGCQQDIKLSKHYRKKSGVSKKNYDSIEFYEKD